MKTVSKFQAALNKNKNMEKVISSVIENSNGRYKTKENDFLKPFQQMGFELIEEIGKETIGVCPFCEGVKFFINKEKKCYSCKNCGVEGGYKGFLNECYEQFQQFFDGDIAQKLSDNRGLSIDTLKEHQIGYNPKTKDYIVPTFDEDNIDVVSIKRFCLHGDKYFLNLSGTHQRLFNSHFFSDNVDSAVFLLEGEWDCMTMREAINQVSGKRGFKDNYITVAVPGATSFKDEWINLFKDRDVIVVFDNDKTKIGKNKKCITGAGTQGSIKVYKKLSPVVKSIKFMHWQVGTKHNYDVRDYYLDLHKNGSKLIKSIQALSRIYPKGIDREKLIQKKSNVMEGAGATAQEVKAVYNKWLKLRDDSVIDILYGSFIGNRYSFIDPIWLFIVGRSGFCKSELLMSLHEIQDSYVLSTLSENSLVSGMVMVDSKEDQSLLPRLNEKILTLKDMTTLLTGPEKSLENIMGQFRAIYDGDYSKAFGTIERRYNSIFGFIAGVTHIIEIYAEKNPAYGERFLMFNMDDELSYDESIDVIMRAMSNVGKEKIMRKEISEIAKKCLHHTFHQPEISMDDELKIATMAQSLSVLRGATLRDKYRPDEILGAPKPEIGTRIAKSLVKLAQGIAAFHGKKEVGKYEIDLIKHVILSSIPSTHTNVIKKMVNLQQEFFSQKELLNFVGLTRKKNEQTLSNLIFLKVINLQQKKSNGLKTYKYFMEKKLKKMVLSTKIFE